MADPFRIQGPASISFSGGRSSGMMLVMIVDAYGGRLPEDCHILFANTGKEREETLEFVRRMEEHICHKIRWLEYRPAKHQVDAWTEVDYATAARQGEPFREIIMVRGYTPNPVARICTQNLKIKPMEGFMRARGYMQKDVHNIAGMRADEPGRVARGKGREDINFVFPLADAGIRKEDVIAFWKGMPFDLDLPSIGGKTLHGNCDLCYLKGPRTIISLIREEPARADWWIKMELDSGKLFRVDRPNYAVLKHIATQPGLFDDIVDEETMPCECTD